MTPCSTRIQRNWRPLPLPLLLLVPLGLLGGGSCGEGKDSLETGVEGDADADADADSDTDSDADTDADMDADVDVDPGCDSLATADARIVGDNASNSGVSLAIVGDQDGDGYDDALIAANRTGAYLVRGPVVGDRALSAISSAFLSDGAENDYEVTSIAGAGDVDGDGLADLLVGNGYYPDVYSRQGIAALYYGPVSGDVHFEEAGATIYGDGNALGRSCSKAGDLNLDGHGDIVIGANWMSQDGSYYPGGVLVYLGPVMGTLATEDADAILWGEPGGEYTGTRVSAAGDANGDGYDDILIMATSDGEGNDWGIAYLASGPLSGTLTNS